MRSPYLLTAGVSPVAANQKSLPRRPGGTGKKSCNTTMDLNPKPCVGVNKHDLQESRQQTTGLRPLLMSRA